MKFIYDLNKVNLKKFDYIFITLKLFDYDLKLISFLKNNIGINTKIIPPCTSLPEWWYISINNFQSDKLSSKKDNISKYFSKESLICMTMWISGYRDGNNFVIRHTQRGYPLKPINKKMNYKAKKLREVFRSSCKSPEIRDIYAEVFIKSLNALAFNMVALYFHQNNKSLKNNKKGMQMIERIMIEGEQIMRVLKMLVRSFVKIRK